jgi:hypothetical protein
MILPVDWRVAIGGLRKAHVELKPLADTFFASHQLSPEGVSPIAARSLKAILTLNPNAMPKGRERMTKSRSSY